MSGHSICMCLQGRRHRQGTRRGYDVKRSEKVEVNGKESATRMRGEEEPVLDRASFLIGAIAFTVEVT